MGVGMIEMTERAAQHVQDFLDNRGKGEGIRVGIRTAGCSGLAYVQSLLTRPTKTIPVMKAVA